MKRMDNPNILASDATTKEVVVMTKLEMLIAKEIYIISREGTWDLLFLDENGEV